MNIFKRIFETLSGLPWQMTVKAAPYIFNYAKDTPLWQMINYEGYVRDGFERNALIYAAIMYKVRAINATRLRGYKGDPQQPDMLAPNHPLAKLLARPNQHQSWLEYEGQNLVYLDLAGNCYIYLDRTSSKALPGALYSLRPDRVRIVPDTQGIKGYLYVPQGQTVENAVPFLPEDIIHIKMPNPGDDLEGMGYGMPPMMPLARSGDVDNHITGFLKLLFEQGTMLPGYLKLNNPIDEREADRLRGLWRERYGGSTKWADIAILDGNADYKPLGQSFKEMDFTSIDERNESRILLPLGVPGILLDTRGGMKNSTYANKSEARRAFWEDTMLFQIRLFDTEYEHYLSSPEAFVQRDLSGVPALQKNVPELVESAYKLWTMGVPANQATRTVGLKLDDIPGGDVSYISANILPADAPRPDEDNPPKRIILRKADDMGDYCILAPLADNNLIKVVQSTVKAMIGDNAAIWIKSRDFHITFAYFSGNRELVASMPLHGLKMPVVVDGVNQFDTPDGFAVYLSVRKSAELTAYQQKLVAAIQSAGLQVSEFSLNWQPHITLAYASQPITPFSVEPFVVTVQDVVISDEDWQAVRQEQLKRWATLPLLPRKSKWSPDEKATIWTKVDNIAQSWEGKFGEAAEDAFEKDRRAVQAILQTAKQKAKAEKATINWLSLLPKIAKYLEYTSPAMWGDTFVPAFAGLVRDSAGYWSTELGFAVDVRNLLGEQWFANYTLRFAQPISETSSNVIQGIIAQAQAEGWSIYDMTERMDQVFTQWQKGTMTPEDFAWMTERAPFWRRELIARTETTRLQNTGSFELFKSWDVPRKEWNSALDGRTRPSHTTANGQIVNMDKPFKVGGFNMMHPGDMTLGAPLSEVADCRCSLLPDID